MLSINLCNFWLLHLCIESLRSWNLLNLLQQQHIQWVTLQKLSLSHFLWHLYKNIYNLLYIKSIILNFDLAAGRWWRFREGTAYGETATSFSCTSFWMCCCCFSGMIYCSTSCSYAVRSVYLQVVYQVYVLIIYPVPDAMDFQTLHLTVH